MAYIAGETCSVKIGSTTVGQVISVSHEGFSRSTPSTTVLGSTTQTKRGSTVYDAGTLTITCYYDPADTGQAALDTALSSSSASTFQIILLDVDKYIQASGFVSERSIDGITQGGEDTVQASWTVTLTGAVTTGDPTP